MQNKNNSSINPDNPKRTSFLVKVFAFLLHKTEAMPYAEIAEVLETSVHAVESLMGRAKQNLKNYLHNYYLKNKL